MAAPGQARYLPAGERSVRPPLKQGKPISAAMHWQDHLPASKKPGARRSSAGIPTPGSSAGWRSSAP